MKAADHLENQKSGIVGTSGSRTVREGGNAAQRAATEIRGLMGARKLNAADLAQTLCVSRDTASRRMSGDNYLTVNELEEIADWLGVTVCRIISPTPGATYSD